jgi:hypothetical protein
LVALISDYLARIAWAIGVLEALEANILVADLGPAVVGEDALNAFLFLFVAFRVFHKV